MYASGSPFLRLAGLMLSSPPERSRRAVLVAALLHTLALVILCLAVWPLPRPGYYDCHPIPDGPEYLAGAVAIARTGCHSIELVGVQHPSRYPPGFSAMIAPWIVLGVEPVRAPFVTNALAAVMLLALVAISTGVGARRVASGLAALFLATTPGFLVLARTPMSELSSAVVTTAAVLSFVAYVRRPRLGVGVAGAVLLGLSLAVRLGNLFFCGVVLVAWLLVRRRVVRPWQHAAWLGAAFAGGVVPLLCSQWAAYGDPFASGYSYWAPGRDRFDNTFGFDFLFDNLRYLAHEVIQREWKPTVATLYGTGDYFGPATVALVAWSVLRAARDRTIRWLLLGVAPYAIAHAAYFHQDARFFVPLLPLAAIVVARQTAVAWAGSRRRSRAAFGALLLLHCLGIPGSRVPVGLPSAIAGKPAAKAPAHDAVVRLATEPPGLVLATPSPVYVKALLGGTWVVAPARDEHPYRWNPDRFRFAAAERANILGDSVARARPVYVLADKDLDAALAENPPPAGHTWLVTWRGPEGGGIACLVRG